MKKILGFVAAACLSFTVTAETVYTSGKEYTVLSNPQPVASEGKIEVIEFFWYGCPHCYHLESEVDSFLKSLPDDVSFMRMPAILGPSWELLARGYYTAEILGVTEKIHKPLFEYLHKQRKRIRSVGDLQKFFVSKGVSKEDFDKTFNSFAVVTKTGRARQVRDRYQLNGVPAIAINGKFVTSPSMAGGNTKVFAVINHLIEQERVLAESQQQPAAVSAK
ncbi:MAG: thiol:disulfide interchange protein DsbA/DsbL [Gammaproteobacteria bacterium]